MDSRYDVKWVRRSGETIAIESMSDLELAAARHMLEREDPFDPVAATLFDAVAEELERRMQEPAPLEEFGRIAPRRAA